MTHITTILNKISCNKIRKNIFQNVLKVFKSTFLVQWDQIFSYINIPSPLHHSILGGLRWWGSQLFQHVYRGRWMIYCKVLIYCNSYLKDCSKNTWAYLKFTKISRGTSNWYFKIDDTSKWYLLKMWIFCFPFVYLNNIFVT